MRLMAPVTQPKKVVFMKLNKIHEVNINTIGFLGFSGLRRA